MKVDSFGWIVRWQLYWPLLIKTLEQVENLVFSHAIDSFCFNWNASLTTLANFNAIHACPMDALLNSKSLSGIWAYERCNWSVMIYMTVVLWMCMSASDRLTSQTRQLGWLAVCPLYSIISVMWGISEAIDTATKAHIDMLLCFHGNETYSKETYTSFMSHT